MTDTQPNELPPIQINAQYVKDLSFEMPNAPAIFADLQNASPEVQIQVNLQAVNIHESMFETTLSLHIEGKAGDKTAFILELAYGGLFTLNVPQEHLQPMLFIECPRLMFPFARNIVADISREGGLPPLMLQPIDFLALFRQRVEQQGQA